MSTSLRFRLPHLLPLLLLVGVLGGCDRGPSGPGSWEGVIQGPTPVGSAFLSLHGTQVEGVEGADGSLVFGNAVQGEGSLRVVVVAPEDGNTLRFRVRVRDRGQGAPTATLVELFDRNDQRIPGTQGFRVEFTR